MTSVAAVDAARARLARAAVPSTPLDVALLGCGNVGSAFAALARRQSGGSGVRITHALVRDRHRVRPSLDPSAVRLDRADAVFDRPADVVVELLGGTEPARTLVLEALYRGIPVVTANKSLLAAHGAELRQAASETCTPLLYEAAVLAGVPFLGTFARRPNAARLTRLVGIANGTSNYVLTRAREARSGLAEALAEAQALGYAEPDPSNDIDGIDAAEKLVVLLQHFAALELARDDLAIEGVGRIDAADIDHARALGGVLKPLIFADWSGPLEAFAAPAFLPADHVLAPVDGAENAVVLTGPEGRLVFRGPGAGPAVTAATVMDDVLEAAAMSATPALPELRPAGSTEPLTGWLLTISGRAVPAGPDIADLLGSHGVYLSRTNESGGTFAALTWPVEGLRLQGAVQALRSAGICTVKCLRAVEST